MSSSICGSEASEPSTVCPSQAEQSKPSNARNVNYGQCERSEWVSLAQTSQIKHTKQIKHGPYESKAKQAKQVKQIKQAKLKPYQSKQVEHQKLNQTTP